MIDESNVHLFTKFNEVIAKVGNLADEFRLLRMELMSLEVDVAREIANEEDDVTDDL
ncbi:MAG: hypothetical protein IKB65_09475 [Ruminiclostridium sp.]|nr:hypothetical protein [Ruminiclostridium sp.]